MVKECVVLDKKLKKVICKGFLIRETKNYWIVSTITIDFIDGSLSRIDKVYFKKDFDVELIKDYKKFSGGKIR
jgi:hypothetical protein